MRLHNFFVREPIGDRQTVEIRDSALARQWRQVLRLNTGSFVVLLDNTGFEYLAQITDLSFLGAKVHIEKRRRNTVRPRRTVHLFLSLLKKDRFEWVLEKGTELGVSHFHPLKASRSVKTSFDRKRVERIVKEASEQSGRGVLPAVYDIINVSDAAVLTSPQLVVFNGGGERFSPGDFLDGLREETVGLVIGPEGGFEEKEIALFRSRGLPIYSLGPQTLRAETAAIAATALVLLR